jgi:hypothetical protein
MSNALAVSSAAPTHHPRFLDLDERVPPAIKRALEEANGCMDMSFMTGGTACARLAIKNIVQMEHAEALDYATSLLTLSEKHPAVAPALFQILACWAQAAIAGSRRPRARSSQSSVVCGIYVPGAERVGASTVTSSSRRWARRGVGKRHGRLDQTGRKRQRLPGRNRPPRGRSIRACRDCRPDCPEARFRPTSARTGCSQSPTPVVTPPVGQQDTAW